MPGAVRPTYTHERPALLNDHDKNAEKEDMANRKALLLGLGLDKDDGPLRITRGENYRLYGGSRPTHAKMQEVAVRVNEDLKQRGKSLEETEPRELRDIVLKAAEKTED